MQIIYGFIYYFTLIMVLFILSLAIFFLKPARSLLHYFWKRYRQFLDNDVIRAAVLLSFTIMGFVFLQSVYTYSILNAHFSRSTVLLR